VLLITGEPGIGKSAIVAALVDGNSEGQVLAYHCCRADTPATLEPARFVRSLAGMLAARLESKRRCWRIRASRTPMVARIPIRPARLKARSLGRSIESPNLMGIDAICSSTRWTKPSCTRSGLPSSR
jgi:predicted ATPase